MSCYESKAIRPNGDKFEDVYMIDDFYAQHHYGVRFPDGKVYSEYDCTFKTRETIDKTEPSA